MEQHLFEFPQDSFFPILNIQASFWLYSRGCIDYAWDCRTENEPIILYFKEELKNKQSTILFAQMNQGLHT
jgi:hypothetical protein